MTLPSTRTIRAALVGLLTLAACGDGSESQPSGSGLLRVTARAPEQAFTTSDGWAIELSTLKISVRELRLGDLSIAGPSELDLSAGVEVPVGEGALTSGSYTDAGFTIERVQLLGTASKDGLAKRFDWSFEEPTVYVRCANQTELASGAQAAFEVGVRPALLFRDSLVSGQERLRFQPVAEADSDDDGEIESDELWERDTGDYELGGRRDVLSLWEFIEALVKQLGHVDGAARCEVAAA